MTDGLCSAAVIAGQVCCSALLTTFTHTQLNYTPLVGRPMRIMWSHRDPAFRKSGRHKVSIWREGVVAVGLPSR
jgi:hypothetical protein